MLSAQLILSRNTTGPVSNIVDYVPLLQRLPSTMHSRARQLHQDLMRTYGGMINEIRQRMSLGKHIPDCLVKTMLTVYQDENLDDVDMAMLASAFMIGGVETVRQS
jgi:cytochrome P450